jgi:hypothetical protein
MKDLTVSIVLQSPLLCRNEMFSWSVIDLRSSLISETGTIIDESFQHLVGVFGKINRGNLDF